MPEILTELDALWAAFMESPGDELNGPALADRLSEEGLHAESLAVRWMHAERRMPRLDVSGEYDWWTEDWGYDAEDLTRAKLPRSLYAALSGYRGERSSFGYSFRPYPTFQDACRALGVALAACPEEVDRV